jgi:hypothetical protein
MILQIRDSEAPERKLSRYRPGTLGQTLVMDWLVVIKLENEASI